MTIWALPIAILITTTILAFPLSRYLRGSWTGNTARHAHYAGLRPAEQRNAGLEALRRLHACFQHPALHFWLSGSCPSTVDAAQWDGKGMLAPSTSFTVSSRL